MTSTAIFRLSYNRLKADRALDSAFQTKVLRPRLSYFELTVLDGLVRRPNRAGHASNATDTQSYTGVVSLNVFSASFGEQIGRNEDWNKNQGKRLSARRGRRRRLLYKSSVGNKSTYYYRCEDIYFL